MIENIKNLPYTERLKKCGLMSLENRRRRYDMIETFKIMKDIYKIDKDKLFEINTERTRGHSLKIKKRHSKINVRKYYFTNRVVNDWNKLPEEAIQAETINQFKKVIDPLFSTEGGLYNIQ